MNSSLLFSGFPSFQSLTFSIHDSKLGVPIKTTVSATVLEEALNGSVTIRPLPLGQFISKRVSFFLLEFIDPVLVTIRYCLFLFWCIHMTGWETMCTLLFSYNNRRGSPSWICLSSAIIREKQVQGLNLILWHWYLKKLHARYALLINFLYLGLCLYGDWFLYRIV